MRDGEASHGRDLLADANLCSTEGQHFFGSGNHAAHAAEKLHRAAAFERQANIVAALADAQLGDQKSFGLRGQLAEPPGGEGVQREGAQQAELGGRAGGRLVDHRFQHAAHDAVAHQDEFGVVGAVAFGARFARSACWYLASSLRTCRSIFSGSR